MAWSTTGGSVTNSPATYLKVSTSFFSNFFSSQVSAHNFVRLITS